MKCLQEYNNKIFINKKETIVLKILEKILLIIYNYNNCYYSIKLNMYNNCTC